MKKLFIPILLLLLSKSYLVKSQESLDSIANVKTVIENEDISLLIELGFDVTYSPSLVELAESGNAAAQNYLGACYLNGSGVKANPKQAFYWFSKAAMGNNIKALNQLGYCYEEGIGTEKDPVQAFLFYKKAAFRGHPNAYVNLAKCYLMGIGTSSDRIRSRAWFEKAAEEGIGVAQSNAGYLYFEEENYQKAFYWMQKACENDMPMACDFLGDCYDNGWGCKKNHQKAIECYRKSYNLGNKNALEKLNNQ